MDTKLYLTIASIVSMLFAVGFLLIPAQTSLFFTGLAEAHVILALRCAGAAVLAWGLILWFARNFRDWEAVRSVLVASIIGLAINIVLDVWGIVQGLMNANTWGSALVLTLLLVGAAYQLATGGSSEKKAI